MVILAKNVFSDRECLLQHRLSFGIPALNGEIETQVIIAHRRIWMLLAVQLAMQRDYDNPNVKRLAFREALSGYGEGLSNILTDAERQAVAEYQPQYQAEALENMQNWQAEIARQRNEFNAALSAYLNRRATTTTTKKLYPDVYQDLLT